MNANTALMDQRRRERYFSLVGGHLPDIYDWVRHEIAALEAAGDLMVGELSPDEVVDAVVLQAYREFVRNPAEREVRRWLLGVARKRLGLEVSRLKTWRHQTVHTEEDVPETDPKEEVSTLGDEILDFFEPDEDLKLEDVIPDLEIPGPEAEMEAEELRTCIQAALAGMPREWRRMFLLHRARGYDVAKLAKMARRPMQEIQGILEHSNQYLRQHLIEAGCMFRPGESRA